MMLLPHILRRMAEHAYRFAGLPEITIPSAAVSDEDTQRWSEERHAKDLEDEPKQRTGEL